VRLSRPRVAARLAAAAAAPAARADPGPFLRAVHTEFEHHQLAMLMVRDIFLYLDRVYAKDDREPVFELGLSLFRDVVVHQPVVQEALHAALRHFVCADRRGDRIDAPLLRAVADMLLKLDNYARRVYIEV
jgi:cullin 3